MSQINDMLEFNCLLWMNLLTVYRRISPLLNGTLIAPRSGSSRYLSMTVYRKSMYFIGKVSIHASQIIDNSYLQSYE